MCLRLKKFVILICLTGNALATPVIPYMIQADHTLLDNQRKIDHHSGHVILEQGKTRVTGNKLTVYRDNLGQLKKAIMLGEPAHYTAQPKATEPPLSVTAKRIIFTAADHRVHFQGQTHAKQGKQIYDGPNLDYYTEQSQLVAVREQGQRPTFVIER